jgi:hypothetical protein
VERASRGRLHRRRRREERALGTLFAHCHRRRPSLTLSCGSCGPIVCEDRPGFTVQVSPSPPPPGRLLSRAACVTDGARRRRRERQADLGATLAARNVAALAGRGQRGVWPQDVCHGARKVPTIVCVSLGKWSGVMQFNGLVLSGCAASLPSLRRAPHSCAHET